MSITDTLTGELILFPGVEKADHGDEDFELRVGGRPFAHFHGDDRLEVRLPVDVKENLLTQGMVSRSPEVHDREGWVVVKLGARPNIGFLLRTLQTAYRYISGTI